MNRTLYSIWAICLVALLPALSQASPSNTIGECTGANKLGFIPKENQVAEHRQFTVPTLTYPFGTRLESDWTWGLMLGLRVNERGQVVCYMDQDFRRFGEHISLKLNEQRSQLLETLAKATYSPFLLNGKPVAAIVTEQIAEEEAPKRHRDLPSVPPDQVRVILERTACYGTCPQYRVELTGSGDALFEGTGNVVVHGKHHYHVDAQKVAALIASARAKDLGSLRPVYKAPVTDMPTQTITLKLGKEVFKVADYQGEWVGMPRAVTRFEQEVDTAADSSAWIHLSSAAVDTLEVEHFPFHSQEGGDLLLRAIADDDGSDDAAILRLIQHGAPWNIQPKSTDMYGGTPGPAIEEALQNERDTVVSALLAQGALKTGETVDQAKLDAAFHAAIAGGRFQLVEEIWNSGGGKHPALTYEDESDDDSPVTRRVPLIRRVPVTLLLSRTDGNPKQWDAVKIAQWLVAKGCDIKAHAADGRTLLHIAAEGEDIELVRYVLAQGVSPSTPGRFRLLAVESTKDEDVALVLLQAGTDFSKSKGKGAEFRTFAVSRNWARVVAWMDAHQK